MCLSSPTVRRQCLSRFQLTKVITYISNTPLGWTYGNATKVLAVSSVSILLVRFRYVWLQLFMLSIPTYSDSYRAAELWYGCQGCLLRLRRTLRFSTFVKGNK